MKRIIILLIVISIGLASCTYDVAPNNEQVLDVLRNNKNAWSFTSSQAIPGYEGGRRLWNPVAVLTTKGQESPRVCLPLSDENGSFLTLLIVSDQGLADDTRFAAILDRLVEKGSSDACLWYSNDGFVYGGSSTGIYAYASPRESGYISMDELPDLIAKKLKKGEITFSALSVNEEYTATFFH